MSLVTPHVRLSLRKRKRERSPGDVVPVLSVSAVGTSSTSMRNSLPEQAISRFLGRQSWKARRKTSGRP